MISMYIKHWYMVYNAHVATNDARAQATQVVQFTPVQMTKPAQPGCGWCVGTTMDAKAGLGFLQSDGDGTAADGEAAMMVFEYHIATGLLTKQALHRVTRYGKYTVKRLAVNVQAKLIAPQIAL